MSTLNYRQPFALEPNRVWRSWKGGAVLDRLAGAAEPQDGYFPEDWVGSMTRAINAGREGIVEGIGTARTGDGQIVSMERVFTEDPVAAMGAAHVAAYGPQPQLLVKLLDSSMRLQIQAHPSAAWAQKHLNSPNGKTEAWWILATRQAKAWVYFGFQRPPVPAAWKRIVREQDAGAMLACFDRVPVKPGDVLLVAGGVPHAIGPGLLMVEVQEPTDWVVRCEFAHGGLTSDERAQTMGLGLDAVGDLFDYTPCAAADVHRRFGPRPRRLGGAPGGTETVLLGADQTDRLELRRIETTGKGPFPIALDGRFSVLIVLDGTGGLAAAGGTLDLKPFSRVFLPAAVGSATLQGQMTIARCMPPKA
ncbi:MAG: phosphoheptose isomerase [Planctomycetes bacterium]|nr:phosphoheptose isomerase [Planctomycetota bacterium]